MAHHDHDDPHFLELLAEVHNHWAAQLTAVCRANGGVYVKFGQFAVAFGAVPREYRQLLSHLEDKARPQPFNSIRRRLLRELRCKPAALVGPTGSGAMFREFDRQATAAASLAQVHRARLAGGEQVAVKIQYPGLRRSVRADLRIMKVLAQLAGAVFPEFSLGWLAEEMEAKLHVELDFRNEIHNANKLRSCLVHCRAKAAVPFMHEELSTPSMIVMEWVDGIKLTDTSLLQQKGVCPKAVGVEVVKLFSELTFKHGYIHGDPHPGNLMVRLTTAGRKGPLAILPRLLLRPRRRPFEIVLLDHGTYLTISPELREQFAQLWCSFMSLDHRVQTEVGSAIAGERAGRILPLLLTKQTKTRKEETELQRAAGVKNVSDMTAILGTAPRDLVELLRINTVIRASTAILGVSMSLRKRIFIGMACKAMPPLNSREPHVHPSSRSVLYRARVLVLFSAWTCWCWTRAVAEGSGSLVQKILCPVFFQIS